MWMEVQPDKKTICFREPMDSPPDAMDSEGEGTGIEECAHGADCKHRQKGHPDKLFKPMECVVLDEKFVAFKIVFSVIGMFLGYGNDSGSSSSI